jgi:hypothetical protein
MCERGTFESLLIGDLIARKVADHVFRLVCIYIQIQLVNGGQPLRENNQ